MQGQRLMGGSRVGVYLTCHLRTTYVLSRELWKPKRPINWPFRTAFRFIAGSGPIWLLIMLVPPGGSQQPVQALLQVGGYASFSRPICRDEARS